MHFLKLFFSDKGYSLNMLATCLFFCKPMFYLVIFKKLKRMVEWCFITQQRFVIDKDNSFLTLAKLICILQTNYGHKKEMDLSNWQ
jgi:hypothetical protein